MFKLASCPNVSQKVQNLVKLLSGSSDPSIVQSRGVQDKPDVYNRE